MVLLDTEIAVLLQPFELYLGVKVVRIQDFFFF